MQLITAIVGEHDNSKQNIIRWNLLITTSIMSVRFLKFRSTMPQKHGVCAALVLIAPGNSVKVSLQRFTNSQKARDNTLDSSICNFTSHARLKRIKKSSSNFLQRFPEKANSSSCHSWVVLNAASLFKQTDLTLLIPYLGKKSRGSDSFL